MAKALEIAGMYRGAELLTGPNATKAQFLEWIRRSEVVHFAGHAIANSEFPWLSRLLFAPGSEAGSDTLFSRELTSERLDQLNLVVLAACSTGTGAGVRGEGVLSLARAFLAAGAPTVIASLWDVSDVASQRLFSSFYQRLRSGTPPLNALRDAQLVALQTRMPSIACPRTGPALPPSEEFRGPQPIGHRTQKTMEARNDDRTAVMAAVLTLDLQGLNVITPWQSPTEGIARVWVFLPDTSASGEMRHRATLQAPEDVWSARTGTNQGTGTSTGTCSACTEKG